MRSNFDSYLKLNSVLSFSFLNYSQAAVAFGCSLLLAKYLGKEDYGYYTYGLVFVNIVIVLATFGMDKTLIRDLVQKNNGERAYMLSATKFKAALGVFVTLGVAIWLISQPTFEIKYIVAMILILGAWLEVVRAKAWYDFSGKIQLHARLTLFERLFFLAAILVILQVATSGSVLLYVAISFVLVRLVFVSYEWWKVKLDFKAISNSVTEATGSIFKNNTWIWLAAIGNLLMSQMNQLVLEGESGIKQLASFGIAFQMVHFVKILQNQLLRLASPNIAQLTKDFNRQKIVSGLLRLSALSLGATLILVIPSYFIAPIFVEAVLGSEYADVIPVFNILLLWVLVYGMALINNQFLVSLHLQKSYFLSTLFFGVVSIFLAYYLVGLYNGRGAALSLLISHGASIAVQVGIVLWFIYRHEELDQRNILQDS